MKQDVKKLKKTRNNFPQKLIKRVAGVVVATGGAERDKKITYLFLTYEGCSSRFMKNH